jgi:cell division protein FtsW (lipid II flippase)
LKRFVHVPQHAIRGHCGVITAQYKHRGIRRELDGQVRQKDRIELVLGLREDPNGDDYNRNRAMAAVGSGGFLGKGYREASVSSVRSNHVPESETDFIFCPFAMGFCQH